MSCRCTYKSSQTPQKSRQNLLKLMKIEAKTKELEEVQCLHKEQQELYTAEVNVVKVAFIKATF